jgi:hypothetical protein
VLGLYPLTQIYQTTEDSLRGDRTIAVCAGIDGALRFGAVCLLLGAFGAVYAALRAFGVADALLIGAGYGLILLALRQFGTRCQIAWQDPAGTCRSVMCLNYATATAFILLIAYHLVRRA